MAVELNLSPLIDIYTVRYNVPVVHYFNAIIFPGLQVPFHGFQFFILFILMKFIEPIIPMDAVIVVFDNLRTSLIYLYLVCKTIFLTITGKQ